jgi:hypothetical protein
MRPLSIHLSYTLHREGSEGCGSGSDSGRGSPQGTSPECQWGCTQQPPRVKDTIWQYPHPANFLQAPSGATLCPRQGHKHCTFFKLLPNCSCWPSRPDEPSMTHGPCGASALQHLHDRPIQRVGKRIYLLATPANKACMLAFMTSASKPLTLSCNAWANSVAGGLSWMLIDRQKDSNPTPQTLATEQQKSHHCCTCCELTGESLPFLAQPKHKKKHTAEA